MDVVWQIECSDGAVLVCQLTRGVLHGFSRTFDKNKTLTAVCW